MKTLYLSMLFVMCASTAQADVYRSVDNEGNVTFTDRSVAGNQNKTIAVPSPQGVTIKKNSASPANKKTISGLGTIKKETKSAVPYRELTIISPANNAVVRANTGNVELKLKLSPSLQTKFGHRIKAELDGKPHASSTRSDRILFTNIDRGTHVFQAYIVDKSGKQLKASQSVSFHVKRFSHLIEPR